MQDCLKLVAALLRGCSEWDPPVDHLRALVGGAYADITTASAALLGVLRAVLARKLVEVVEVYDVMKRIQVGSASHCPAIMHASHACSSSSRYVVRGHASNKGRGAALQL